MYSSKYTGDHRYIIKNNEFIYYYIKTSTDVITQYTLPFKNKKLREFLSGNTTTTKMNMSKSRTNSYISKLQTYTFEMFPNPAKDNVTFNLNPNETVNMNVYDVTGKIVYSKSNITGIHTINTCNIPTGIYIIRINNSKGSGEQKLVILK